MIKMYRSVESGHRKEAGAKGKEQLYVLTQDGCLQGYCKYRLETERIVLLDLRERENNIMLADALVRAAVAHYRDWYTTVECGKEGLLPAYRRYTGQYVDENRESVENVLRKSCGL